MGVTPFGIAQFTFAHTVRSICSRIPTTKFARAIGELSVSSVGSRGHLLESATHDSQHRPNETEPDHRNAARSSHSGVEVVHGDHRPLEGGKEGESARLCASRTRPIGPSLRTRGFGMRTVRWGWRVEAAFISGLISGQKAEEHDGKRPQYTSVVFGKRRTS